MLGFRILIMLASMIGNISSERLVCPVNSQSFISTSRTLLPLENIRSTSESLFNPTPNFVNRGDAEAPWCTAANLPTIEGEYVELNFTEPVVVGMLMSGGFVSAYVNNFTFHFTMSSTEDNFEAYGPPMPTQDFLVPNLNTANANFVLGEQVLARRVRFVVNDGMVNQQDAVCWKMLLFGCTMNEAQTLMGEVLQQTDTPPTTMASPSTTSVPTTSLVSTEDPSILDLMDCALLREQAQNNLLLIILPAVIAVILIIIVIVAILLCVCCMRANAQKRLEYNPAREIRSRTKEVIDNGTTTPCSSVNFHYDNPRFLCYDVPRSSIRSRQHSDSLSTLGSVAEVKNPVYAAKKSLPDYADPTYHMPPGDDGNDYEDIPGGSPTELERRTFTNTGSNTAPHKPAPPIFHDLPILQGSGVTLDGPRSPSSPSSIQYSQVYKLRSKEKDDMENENEASPSPPVINSHYASSTSNNALVQEIDRLVTDLENSRAIAKQW